MGSLVSTSSARERFPIRLAIGGLTRISTIDFPDRLSAVVFCQGCPYRCPYCHNPHLLKTHNSDSFQWSEVEDFLLSRRGLLDAVVFSGGEPTMQEALSEAMASAKNLGYLVGLHTAGAYPKRLPELLRYLDRVGLDVKAPLAKYRQITGVTGSGEALRESARLLLAAGIPTDFRTTIHPSLLSEKDIERIAEEILELGARSFTLQRFRATGCNDKKLGEGHFAGYPGESLLSDLGRSFPHFALV